MGGLANISGLVTTIARGCAICVVALLCVIAYTAGSLRRLVIRDHAARITARERQRGKLLRWSFEQLGASFIKIGQVMSARADLLAPAVIAELRELQDHVPPFSAKRARAIIERELHAPLSSIFRSFDPKPVAAGGIAQVHHAVLANGDEVALKIVRPGVRARIRRDARILLWLAHFAHVVSVRARAADVIGHTRTLVAGIMAQTDLRREADNYDCFRANFSAEPGVAFPRVYRELSTSTLLTMEFIHGVHLEHVPAHQLAQVATVLRRTFFAMCFEHGLVHADLHPGNVLVTPDGMVVLVDVGLVKQLTPQTVEVIVELACCLVSGTADDLVWHLQEHHPHRRSTNWNAVATDARAFIEELRTKTVAQLEAALVVGRLFALARKHGIRPLSELSLVLLGMVTIEGIAKRLEPDVQTIAEVTRYLAPHIARSVRRPPYQWRDERRRGSFHHLAG